jgi:poly(3-hydroxybutyrate) depolymerase
LGITAVLGCAPATRVDSFVEPVSGRPYRVVSLADHDRGRPAKVLFSLHAYATPPDMVVEGYSLVRHAVQKRGLLLVVPEGQLDALGHHHWNASAACCGEGPRNDDLGYLRAVLRDLPKHYKIDRSQVFAFGVSNGSFMAQRWACAGHGELSAIVSIAGAGPGPNDEPCTSTKPVSVLHMHGTADEIIPYGGSSEPARSFPSAPTGMARWVAIDGCSPEAKVSQRRTLFLERLTVQTWASSKARVSLWSIEGGDHNLRSVRYLMPELIDFLLGH